MYSRTSDNRDDNSILWLLAVVVVLIITFLFILASAAYYSPVVSSNNDLKLSTNTIDWGTLRRDEAYSRHIYLEWTGMTQSQPLKMTFTCSVGNLTWNLENKVLQPGEHAKAIFTLRTHKTAVHGAFNASITVTA